MFRPKAPVVVKQARWPMNETWALQEFKKVAINLLSREKCCSEKDLISTNRGKKYL